MKTIILFGILFTGCFGNQNPCFWNKIVVDKSKIPKDGASSYCMEQCYFAVAASTPTYNQYNFNKCITDKCGVINECTNK